MAQQIRTEAAMQEVATLIAIGMSLAEAAKQAGISTETARRYAKEPKFKEHVNELRTQRVEIVYAHAIEGSVEAIDTLRRCMSSINPPAVQVAAARAMLATVSSTRDSLEFRERLLAVERSIQQLEPPEGSGEPGHTALLDGARSGRTEEEGEA